MYFTRISTFTSLDFHWGQTSNLILCLIKSTRQITKVLRKYDK